MSKLGRTLFGGSESKSTPRDMTPEAFRGLQPEIAEALRGFLGNRSNPLSGIQGQTPQGPFAAAMTPQEAQTLQILGGFTGTTPGSEQAQNLLSQTVGGQFLPGQEGGNPFLQQVIDAATRPAIEAFERDVMPNLRAEFTRGGQLVGTEGGSSPFTQAIAQAGTDLTRTVGDISSNIMGQAFETERNRQQTAAQQLPQLESADVERTLQVLQSQQLPRMIEQLGIDRGLEVFQQQVNAVLQALGVAGGVASPTIANQTSQTSQRGLTQGFSDIFSPFSLGGGGGGGGGF